MKAWMSVFLQRDHLMTHARQHSRCRTTGRPTANHYHVAILSDLNRDICHVHPCKAIKRRGLSPQDYARASRPLSRVASESSLWPLLPYFCTALVVGPVTLKPLAERSRVKFTGFDL